MTKEFNNDNLLIIDIIMKDRRNTMQRELTYNTVLSYPGHPSAEDIYRVISSRYSTISKATVYRNLNMLADDGKIGKVPSMLGYEEQINGLVNLPSLLFQLTLTPYSWPVSTTP